MMDLEIAMQRMPISNVTLDDSSRAADGLISELQSCDNMLNGIIADVRGCADSVVQSAIGVSRLDAVVQEERSELLQAASLLKTLAALEVEERSLGINELQIREETTRMCNVAWSPGECA